MTELLPRHGALPARRSVHVLISGLVIGLLAALLASAPAAASAERRDPANDYPHLPAACVPPGKIIQQKPLICYHTDFDKTRPTMMLWGDSHAWQHLPALRPVAERSNVNLISVVLGGCPPVKGRISEPPGGYKSLCEESNAKAMRVVSRFADGGRPFKVMLGSNWAGYRRVFNELARGQLRADYPEHVLEKVRLAHKSTRPLFDWLAKKQVDVEVIAQVATVPIVHTPECAGGTQPYVCSLKRKVALPNENATRKWLQGLMVPLVGTPGYVDVNNAFCSPSVCRGRIRGIYTFYDLLHLSATRSRTNQKFFMDSFRFLP